MNLAYQAKLFRREMDIVFPRMYRDHPTQPALAVAEEAGEAVGAIRRALGLARRNGTWHDVGEELADVVFSAYIAAEVYGIDLDEYILHKVEVVFSRGFKEISGDVS